MSWTRPRKSGVPKARQRSTNGRVQATSRYSRTAPPKKKPSTSSVAESGETRWKSRIPEVRADDTDVPTWVLPMMARITACKAKSAPNAPPVVKDLSTNPPQAMQMQSTTVTTMDETSGCLRKRDRRCLMKMGLSAQSASQSLRIMKAPVRPP